MYVDKEEVNEPVTWSAQRVSGIYREKQTTMYTTETVPEIEAFFFFSFYSFLNISVFFWCSQTRIPIISQNQPATLTLCQGDWEWIK